MSNESYEKYLKDIIKLHPNLSAGRINYSFFYKRIIKQLTLIKKFKKGY